MAYIDLSKKKKIAVIKLISSCFDPGSANLSIKTLLSLIIIKVNHWSINLEFSKLHSISMGT